jgi:putative transcriptional regulator
MEKRRIHNKIRALRFHHGEITQEQLAEKTGVTRQTILAIEAAKYSPSLELAFRIAQAFGVPIGEVFTYEPDDKDPQQPLQS